ncbi:MAG: hypothetical protein IJU65_02325 [Desulfovibrio sp.]|nr:hypothetical protein [Desulfovibrio sp.]
MFTQFLPRGVDAKDICLLLNAQAIRPAFIVEALGHARQLWCFAVRLAELGGFL